MEKLEIKDIQNLNPTATYKFEMVEEQKENKSKQIIEYINLGLTLIAVIELLILII